MTELERLGINITGIAQKIANRQFTITTELGQIRKNLALKVPTLSNTIPKGDYLLAGGVVLSGGETVLVIWCDNEPIVAAVLGESQKVEEPQAPSINPYPVGSVYSSVINKNPAEHFGGTWEEIKNTYLVLGESATEIYTWQRTA